MTAQPVHGHEPSPVPRNAEGIAAALSGDRRMEFYREMLAAAPEEAEVVLRRWWCEAMLDADQATGDRPAPAVLLHGAMSCRNLLNAATVSRFGRGRPDPSVR